LISTWYKRGAPWKAGGGPHGTDLGLEEQQLRFAYLQTGEIIVLATGGIVNYGVQIKKRNSSAAADIEQLNHLNGRGGLKGWQWMFVVQGLVSSILGYTILNQQLTT